MGSQSGAWLTPAKLDFVAIQFEQAHRVGQQALLGVFARALDRASAPMGNARQYLAHASAKVVETRYHDTVTYLHEISGRAMHAGINRADRTLSRKKEAILEDLVLETISQWLLEYHAVLLRDADAVRRAWVRFQTEVQLATPRYGRRSAEMLRVGRLDQLKFLMPDRAGRRWDSALLARTMLRSHLVLTQTEACLFACARTGKDMAKAVWGDERHEITFSISGKSPKHPSYLSLRESLFHPNSTAQVEPA